jgi:hypothetical protein
MINNHRFILEPYKGMDNRFVCPCCQHRRNTFTRYIDTVTQTYLADHAGKCDRIEKCAYHFTPKQFFKTNADDYRLKPAVGSNTVNHHHDFDIIPNAVFEGSLRRYYSNTFCMFIARMFGAEAAIALIEKYRVGTAKHWPGATIFWQIDINNKVRTGKIMLYNKADCHRVKQPFNHIAWVHRLLSQKSLAGSQKSAATEKDLRLQNLDYNLKQCFFGEHLLANEPFKIVAITESEKTAIIASYYYPNYIWLAAGSLEGLSLEKCKTLKNRTVRLYPDVNGYAKWHSKARLLNVHYPAASFTVDDTLLRTSKPADREKGIDIADKWIDALLLEWEVEAE